MLRTRDGKRYLFPEFMFQDIGAHYLIDFIFFQRRIPKGAVDTEIEFTVYAILKAIGFFLLILLFLNALLS